MKFYIMKNTVEKFQGPYKTWIAAVNAIAGCEKSAHINLSVHGFVLNPINRQFKIESGKRMVLSKISKLHCYHIECAPDNAIETWCRAQQTYCAKCHKPLYKKTVLAEAM